jgi:hypothetical protein
MVGRLFGRLFASEAPRFLGSEDSRVDMCSSAGRPRHDGGQELASHTEAMNLAHCGPQRPASLAASASAARSPLVLALPLGPTAAGRRVHLSPPAFVVRELEQVLVFRAFSARQSVERIANSSTKAANDATCSRRFHGPALPTGSNSVPQRPAGCPLPSG